MGNMCCRRVVYSPNGAETDNNRCQQQQQQQHPQKTQTMSTAYHNAGDDCAINELLEGRMDLDVILPDGRQVRLTVERRTPMMDLLVQAASATKISPGGHVIHIFGDGNKDNGTLQYKPSTPIGSLDTNTICIVPKKEILDAPGKRAHKIPIRPFEPTFRVQVHLPRNQLTVLRVSPRVKISELRNMVCQEKGLDTSRYQLVRPSDPAQTLSGDMTLSEYGSTEITLLSNSSIESHICNSTSHIIPYSKRTEERKKKTGILRLLAEDVNHNTKLSSLNNLRGNQTTLPASKSETLNQHHGRYKPKKRRPAPPPPPPTLPEAPSHSRQSSSDSSGYHEATSSFFHEEHSSAIAEKASSDSSGVSSLDAKVTNVQPQAPPVPNQRKRKAPPPPPPTIEDQALDKQPVSAEPRKEESSPIQSAEIRLSPPTKVAAQSAGSVVEITKESPSSPEQKADSEPVSSVESSKSCKDLQLEKPKSADGGEAVTRVALAALNARIEQDVTQQEIASSIQAAFHSLDCPPQRVEPSLLAIKQRTSRRELINGVVAESLHQRPPPVRHEISSNPVIAEPVPQKSTPARKEILNKPVVSESLHHRSPTPRNEVLNKPVVVQEPHRTTVRLSLNLPTKETNHPPIVTPGSKFSEVEKEALVIDEDPLPRPSSACSLSSKRLKRSSSLLNLADSGQKSVASKNLKRVKHLQRSLSDLSVDDKEEFEAEQERLHREYIKLQRQFILWQQQLLNNHAMLREECIVPQYARTLRQSHSLPEGEDYSTESPASAPPLVSRSLSYEPTKDRCSTLPRSTINIPSLEFGSIQVNNGSSTLRSSKTKSYFKPPQVRATTKSRQRLPPEIKKEGDLDITDDSQMLATILPTFESLKLISENNDEDFSSSVARLKNPPLSVAAENGRNAQLLAEKKPTEFFSKLSTFPRPSSGLNAATVQRIQATKCVNGDTGQAPECVKAVEQSLTSQLPPPPPPMPTGEAPKGTIVRKPSGQRKSVERKDPISQIDPREQLMLEIRKFGGRTSLRKISLAS